MSKIPTLLVDRAYDLSNVPAAAGLISQAWASADLINGIDDDGLIGALPGALLKLNTDGEAVLANGDTDANIIGVCFTFLEPFVEPSAGLYTKVMGNDQVAYIPLSDSEITTSLYATQEETLTTPAALTYNEGDLLHRSRFGVLTNDTALAAKKVVGQVKKLNADGTLTVQLFRIG